MSSANHTEIASAPGRSSRPDSQLLIAARVCLLSVALLSASIATFLYDSVNPALTGYVYLPIAALFAFSAGSALWIKWKPQKQSFLLLQLTVDVLTATGAIYLTGGPSSPFLFLYLPLVMSASIISTRKVAIFTATLSVAVYGLLAFLMIQQIIPPADGSLAPHQSAQTMVFQISGLYLGMFLTAILTGFLAREMRSSHRIVEQSKKDLEELSSSQRALEEQLAMQNQMARLLARKDDHFITGQSLLTEFVGESPVMQKVFTLISKVASSDATILITGESGTGKELVAKAIHKGRDSGRGPFVAVNCGAIPENLIESQLFGHKKGSFTGAEADHSGLFVQADGGTIFLDEIGELPLLMQAKLLRAIQEKCVRPIGGTRDIPMNVRIIAATNKNLKKEVELANFREDLYYRLNVISVQLPPLRSRREDIPLLVRHILKRILPADKSAVIPPDTMQLLTNYHYPGNVRELENLLERAVVLGGEVILPEHLPSGVRETVGAQRASAGSKNSNETNIIIDENIDFPVNLDEILASVERKYLEVALLKTSGVKKRAADLLGINFRSFRYRLQKFGISEE
ncbi:MAG: sigma 54-interacting transcriptional regulator [Deltaproteobacteria bacterium]|nr:sigma 54-interacting transcriptional regulator [Deltaproteobacteria bacterium]